MKNGTDQEGAEEFVKHLASAAGAKSHEAVGSAAGGVPVNGVGKAVVGHGGFTARKNGP
jgi:hypothetical protein